MSSIIDLHALPGSQNQHWHSDNPDGHAAFWDNRQYQDRVVHIWEAIADRWGGDGIGVAEVTRPLRELIATESGTRSRSSCRAAEHPWSDVSR